MKNENKCGDVVLNKNNSNGVTISSGEKWYLRLWFTISNPIVYIFAGYKRF